MVNRFRKAIKFQYKNKRFQMFFNQNNRIAFLEIDSDGKYKYPELNDFLELIDIFYVDNDIVFIKNEKYKFVPKVKKGGVLVLLTAALLSSCTKNHNNTTLPSTPNTSSIELADNTVSSNEIDQEKIKNKYLEVFATADDEFDYEFANDYQVYETIKYRYVRDSKNYDKVLGYSNKTEKDIIEKCNSNNAIPKKYKDFIIDYVNKWEKLYPGSDFSIFYHNLETLQIKEVTKNDMMFAALSTSSVACYKKDENTIYLLDTIDISETSQDYIVFTHELTHCARYLNFEDSEGYKNYLEFSNDTYDGFYTEEGLITHFCYELQGLDAEPLFYTLQTNLYGIITDCIGYDGSDFMNHSVNHLKKKMDEFMETEEAYLIIPMMDCQTALRYADYLKVDFHEFDDIYDYITRMYMKKYLNDTMTYDEAKTVYEEMMNKVTRHFEKVNTPYDINYQQFEDTFEKCVDDFGISKEENYTR